MLNAYSAITQTYTGAFNGAASNTSFTASYKVVYASPTTFKVDITDETPAKTYLTTAWILKDGTVIGLVIDGHSFNASASTSFQTYFSLWEVALGYAQLIESYTPTTYLKSTGTSTVTLGPSAFPVTNYSASSLPETIPGCDGDSTTLTAGSFSVGTPSGSNYPLVTYFDAAGSKTASGSTETFSFIGRMTSVTVA
jgi:hypothetical protein